MNPFHPAKPQAAPQVLPAAWLRPWSAERHVPGATRLHRRVRWTFYIAFFVMAAALLLQAALQARGEHARSGEAAMLDMAGLQSTFSQQLAWRAAQLAQAEAQTGAQTATQTDTDTDTDTDTASSVVTDRSEQGAALEQLLNTSMREALQFEALVARQVQTAGAAQAGLAAALDHWLAVRERLWYRGGTLLYHLDAAPGLGDTASPVVAAAGAVQIEAERALQAAQALSDRLRSLAEHRGERQRAELQLWATGLLLLLGLLALVAERTRAMVLITDAKGRTVWVNQAFTDITGWPLAKALGQQPAALLRTSEASNDDDVAATATASATTQCSLRAALASGTGVRVDCRARARDGSELWLDCDLQPVHDDDGRLTGWVNVDHDITIRRSLQEQLHASARTDALTRLPNRAAVMERLQRAIEHARRHPGYGFAVLFMDFDRFKQVNDTLGHTMGDELLRQIAVRLETTLRPGDAVARVDSDLQLAARLGGDEFVVVLEGVHDASTVGAVADIEQVFNPQNIRRQNLQRREAVFAGVKDRSPGDVGAEVQQLIKDTTLPPGYSFDVGGQMQQQAEAFGGLLAAMALAVNFIYIVLASQFGSFVQPIAIMASLPLALIGVMLALLLWTSTLNIFSMIGLVMLMGLVTKNAILLVDFANQARQAGATVAEALLQAGRTRMRPIIMTTAAMIFGMLPLALALNDGGEIQAPMGRAIIGGLITSTLLTLVVVPVLYSYLVRDGARQPAPAGQDGVVQGGGGAPMPMPADRH